MSPKTTFAGYLTLAGTVLAVVGESFSNTKWGQLLLTLGLAITGGGAARGLVVAKDDH